MIVSMYENLDKLYDTWNHNKKLLSKESRKILFKEGDIWWCSLGINLGTESFGKGKTFHRPVLVIKKLSRDSCIVIPLTTKEKMGTWFEEITIHGERRWAMVYQIRMLHTKRFQRRIATLDYFYFMKVKEKLEELLEFNHHPL